MKGITEWRRDRETKRMISRLLVRPPKWRPRTPEEKARMRELERKDKAFLEKHGRQRPVRWRWQVRDLARLGPLACPNCGTVGRPLERARRWARLWCDRCDHFYTVAVDYRGRLASWVDWHQPHRPRTLDN
jgi:hypothetical protein